MFTGATCASALFLLASERAYTTDQSEHYRNCSRKKEPTPHPSKYTTKHMGNIRKIPISEAAAEAPCTTCTARICPITASVLSISIGTHLKRFCECVCRAFKLLLLLFIDFLYPFGLFRCLYFVLSLWYSSLRLAFFSVMYFVVLIISSMKTVGQKLYKMTRETRVWRRSKATEQANCERITEKRHRLNSYKSGKSI